MEKLTGHIVSELNNGAFDCPEVKCGFIGEIGCCDPLDGKDWYFVTKIILTYCEKKLF